MVRNNFAIFILTHGRADNIQTLKTLERCNYSGKWYMIIDNEDKTADKYYNNFGKDHVIMFDKKKKSLEFDTCDLPTRDRRAIVYARNACFDIAKDLGLTYFLELDDDYTEFRMRYNKDGVFSSIYVTELDLVIEETLDFLDTSNALTVAWAQTGDFLGGMDSNVYKKRLTRKAMNSFFCRTDRPFGFIGRINEDVNTYVWRGTRGELMFTVADLSLNQLETQKNSGGMSDLYLNVGTYIKSFYSVIVAPSCVKISEIGGSHRRIHHLVAWENCTPKIISSKFRNYKLN